MFPWKVPSLNELNFMRGITGKKSWLLKPGGTKSKSGYQFNAYNQTKQDWEAKCTRHILKMGFNKVESCHFHYLVVENTVKRDPSNICSSATKFIEDSLQKVGVIPNDGWKQVLGIRQYWHLDRDSDCGVMLVMADQPLSQNAIVSYYNQWKLNSNSFKELVLADTLDHKNDLTSVGHVSETVTE